MSVQLSPTVILDVQPSPPRGTAACDLDRMLHKWQSRFTGGRSPSTVPLASMDWAAPFSKSASETKRAHHVLAGST
jgi:polyhydroxyalkanoate synthase